MKVLFLFCDAILLAALPGPTPFFHFIARAACNLNISGKIGFIHEITVQVSVTQPPDTITILQPVYQGERLNNSILSMDMGEKPGSLYRSVLSFVSQALR